MLNQLLKYEVHGGFLNMMNISKDGAISKRRIKVLLVGKISFEAYPPQQYLP